MAQRSPVRKYLHAKMFDNAMIESANCNDCGYSYDSGVSAGLADHAWQEPNGTPNGWWWWPELNLAHKLRIELWAEHLAMRFQMEDLIDGVASEIHGRERGPDRRVTDYRREGLLWHEVDYARLAPWGLPDSMGDPSASDYRRDVRPGAGARSRGACWQAQRRTKL